MARSIFDALLKEPERMGARTQSRNTLGINHPLSESSPVARIPISMMPGGGPVSGYTQEDLATLALPKETTLFSPFGYDITDKDLAKVGLATDSLDLIPGAAILGGMATGAGALGRALKVPGDAATSMDDIGAALLGQSLQRQGALDDAMVAYQGSPHKFDALDPTKIGTGEGAQAFGHGMYVAENKGVASSYKQPFAGQKMTYKGESVKVSNAMAATDDMQVNEVLSSMANASGDSTIAKQQLRERLDMLRSEASDWGPNLDDAEIGQVEGALSRFDKIAKDVNYESSGYLYEIDVPDEDIAKMLDWDAPLSEQPWFRDVKELAAEYKKDGKPADNYAKMIARANARGDVTGKQFYEGMTGTPAEKSAFLERAGIPGIKYYDGGSRAAGDGTRNMVLFDELARRAEVLKRNDEAIAEPSVDEFIGKLLED